VRIPEFKPSATKKKRSNRRRVLGHSGQPDARVAPYGFVLEVNLPGEGAQVAGKGGFAGVSVRVFLRESAI
jgi:hypothetical protein